VISTPLIYILTLMLNQFSLFVCLSPWYHSIQ
jgi:hypothetical protein